MKETLEEIIKNKRRCYFVSPHLDDAAFSAGGLISYLADKTSVTVITVFTKSGEEKHSLSALSYIRQCGYGVNELAGFYRNRRGEDREVFESRGVEVVHLGFLDALWRPKKQLYMIRKGMSKLINEFKYIYPTHRWHISKGIIAKDDEENLRVIEKKLREVVGKSEAIIFCPIGLGRHVDHMMTREVCTNAFSKVIYWEDAPYNLYHEYDSGHERFIKEKNLKGYMSKLNRKERKAMYPEYRTQFGKLFGGEKEFSLKDEKYFLNKLALSLRVKNKLTVTVGIPAHNEAASIGDLLRAVVSQKQNAFKIVKIIVISDNSTDRTVEIARNSGCKKLSVIDSKEQLGKNKRFNQIADKFVGDVLVQIDADMKMADEVTLEELIRPFVENPNVAISCAYHYPANPTTFIEKVAFFGFKIWDRARRDLGKKGEGYYCEGGLRAFSRGFIDKYRLPENVPLTEDAYSYYYAKMSRCSVAIVKEAVVCFKLPNNYRDYSKQMKRFGVGPDQLKALFGVRAFRKYNTITMTVKLRALTLESLRDPFYALSFICITLLIRLERFFYRPDIVWEDVGSTKIFSKGG